MVVVQMVVAGRAEMATPPPRPPPLPPRTCQGGVRRERERGDRGVAGGVLSDVCCGVACGRVGAVHGG